MPGACSACCGTRRTPMRASKSTPCSTKERAVAKTKSFFSRGRKVQTTERFVTEMQRAGLIMQRAGSGDGAEWTVDGNPLNNFASCSYMGLERHPELLAGAEAALHKYGANFSISRSYLQCP